MKYAFRFPQRSLHWDLFRVPNDGIISANSVGSDMLARRYPRGTAGRAVSVAPKKLAWALILIGVFGFAAQGWHSQKSSARPSIEFTKIPPAAQGGRERVDTLSGRLRNARPKQQIVIYAHSRQWWVQPWPEHPFIPIKADSTWSTETHLGFEYASLLVEPDFHPLPTMDVAPTQSASVALVKIMKGVGTPQFAPTGSLKFSGYDWAVRMIESDKGGVNKLYDPENDMDRYERGAPHADQEEIGLVV